MIRCHGTHSTPYDEMEKKNKRFVKMMGILRTENVRVLGGADPHRGH